MAAQTPFRITPSLGPDLWQVGAPYYWDLIAANPVNPSYQLGSVVVGNDGHEYVHVKNGTTALAANARINLTEATWTAAADVAGTHVGPAVAVPAGAFFHARRFAF